MVNRKELNQQILRSMFNSIRSAEIKNIKTQKKDDKSMVRAIEEYISNKVGEEMKRDED